MTEQVETKPAWITRLPDWAFTLLAIAGFAYAMIVDRQALQNDLEELQKPGT